jgi:HK97 family phage prohead protease
MEQKAQKSGYKEGYFGGEVKELNTESRTVSGYYSAKNMIDSDQDVLLDGFAKKSIAERGPDSDSNRKIVHLHQHNTIEPVGAIKTLIEDSYGLYFESMIEDTPLGDIVLERYKNGTYREHSFGFSYVAGKCEWGEFEGKEAYLCSELKIYEGSTVTFGANENTPFTGFKGSHQDFLKELEEQEQYMIKTARNFLEEITFKQMFAREKSLYLKTLAVQEDTKQKDKAEFEEQKNAKEQRKKEFYQIII